MRRTLLVLGSLLLGASRAHAIDGVAIEGGTSGSSDVSVDMARIAVQWDWGARWALGPGWHIGGYWDLAGGYWRNDSRNRSSSGIWDIGFTPVFRLQQSDPAAIAPYGEAAIGFHFISKTSINSDRQLSTAFQFGDHLGIGVRFGPKHAYDVGYRFQHLSNAGIKKPNDGIDFHELRLQYHF